MRFSIRKVMRPKWIFLALKISLLLHVILFVIAVWVPRDAMISKAVGIISLPADLVGRWIHIAHPNALAIAMGFVLSVVLDTVIVFALLAIFWHYKESALLT